MHSTRMKPTISRILVPTDFSAFSDAAIEYGKMLGDRFGASLHVLHIIEEPGTGAWGSELYVSELPRMREAAQREADRRIDQTFTAAERERLRVSTEIADGHAARTIVNVGRRLGADLIVMGTHGRSGVTHLLLGSVAERVIRTATCPVLAVRTTEHEAGAAGNRALDEETKSS